MYLTYLLLLGLAIVCNSILLVVFYRHSQRNITTFSLFLLLLLVNIWFIPKFITNATSPTGSVFESLSRIAALGYVFVPATLLVFTLSFGKYQKVFTTMSFWFFLLLPPIIFLYLSWTSNLIGVHTFNTAKLQAWGYETPTGFYWPHYLVWYDTMIILSVGILIKYYRSMLDQTKKKQTLYFIYAIIFPLMRSVTSITIVSPILTFCIFQYSVGFEIELTCK